LKYFSGFFVSKRKTLDSFSIEIIETKYLYPMKNVDYIIVGLGIAGISFCEQLYKHNKSFVVVDKGFDASTAVSGGVINPVVLKRFTIGDDSKKYLETTIPFYNEISVKLKETIFIDLPVLRIFNSIEEQNNWMVAGDKKELETFLSSEIIKNSNSAIKAPFGFGKVNGTGKIFPSKLLSLYGKFLQKQNKLLCEIFEYDNVSETNNKIHYKDISASKIVFTEGASAVKNPFFPKEFLQENKGEYILIKAPTLKVREILKGPMFIIPLGDNLYKVGATYNREDDSREITDMAKNQIIEKLKKMILCDFEVVDQVAGIRPTVKDRKPLLGNLSESNLKVFFNGLGTRGLLMAPLLSAQLYDYLENNIALPRDININRFEKKIS